jgi:iron complex transport system substrate-binding protein
MPRAGRVCRWLAGLALLAVPIQAAAGDPIFLPQSDGDELRLEQAAHSVVALAPNLTEMVFAAGAGSKLLATVEYSDYPQQAQHLPRVGDAFRFDLERIMALQPDLVMAWNSGNPAQALAGLEELGFLVWRIELQTPGDIPDLLEHIARATGTQGGARQEAERLRHRLGQLSDRHAGKPPVRYFYQVAERPLFTLNGEHIVSRGLSLCGGVNIFDQLPVLAPQVSREAVLAEDPDIVFAPRVANTADPLAHWRAWPRLRAVRNEALYFLPADQISRATPRMLDSLELACTLLDQHRNQQPQTMESK